MRIEGYKRSNFQSKEGNTITGINLYVSYPLTAPDSEGIACERFYFSDAKLEQCGYFPHLGDEVEIQYNRYGKPAAIYLMH